MRPFGNLDRPSDFYSYARKNNVPICSVAVGSPLANATAKPADFRDFEQHRMMYWN